MTLADTSPASESSLRFATLGELHTAHAELLRGREKHDLTAAVLDAATTFVERGVRTGALLYDTTDRRAAQSLLNYWSNILYRAGREPPDALLMLFDQSQAPLLDDALCPYIGLDPFDEQRKNLFFGRRDLVNELIEHLREHRFLTVVGPSGSGKSSLVRAGLIPALRAGALAGSVTWRYIPPMMPGSNPLGRLAQLFRPRSADPADWERRRIADFLRDDSHLTMLIGKLPLAPTVLVIDQFEELFTLVDNKHEVRAFAANLARLAETPGLRHTVIVTLREEFVQRIADVPPLEGLFRDSRKQVTVLLRAELREAIVQPAKQVGLIFDEWVVDRLVEDLAGDPAVLPLLQFTLRQLWINKDRNRITRTVYSKVGEGGKALEQAADAFYNRQPAQQNRDTIKLILLRMVEARQRGEFTSRRIRRESLYTIPNDPGRIDRMLKALIEAGLVRLTRGATPTDDQVELAHEALIRNWQKLRDWLDEQRARLRERQRLTSAADQWNAGGRDDGALWVSRELVKTTHDYSDLSPLEQAFVAASKAAIQAQEDAARRELEQVQALAEERAGTNRRLQRQRRWLIITALVAIIAAGFAYWQYRLAEERREQLSAQALVLSMQSFRTDSDLFLRAAIWLAEHNQPSNLTRIGYSNPSDTLRLSLQNILQQAIQINLPAITHNGMTDADWSSDGQLIITSGADKVLRMWNIKTLEDTGFTPQQSYPISRTVLSTRLALGTRNPKQLLTADDNGSARILDTSTGATLHTFTHDGNAIHPVLNDAIWSPDERQVLTTGTERQVLTAGTENVSETMKLWDVDQNTLHCRLGKYNVNARVNAVAWSPDGHYIFTAIDDTSYHLWEIDGDQCREHMGFASSMRQTRTPSITAAVWSPDGQLLLTATNQLAEIWRIKKGAISAEPVARLVGHTEPIIRIAWSPDGKRILTAGEDKTIRFWDVDEQLSNNSNDPQRTISVKQRSELRGDWERIITAVWSPDSHAILVATSEKRGVTAADTEETVRVYYADDFDKVLRVARSQLTRSQKQKGDLLTHQELQILIETSQDAMPWLEQEAAATQTAEARVSQPTIGAEQTADTLTPQSETSSPLPMSPTVDITYTPLPTSSPTILAATATATATGVLAGTGVLTDTTALTPTITIIPVPLPTSADATLLPTPEPPTPTEVVVDTPIPTPTSTPPAVSPAPNAPPPSQLLGHTDFVLEARFSADGKLVASASKDGTARVWQASDGTQLLVLLHSARVNSVAFSPKENIILTSSDDQKGRIWDANNGRLIAELPHDGRVNNAEFSPDGRWVVTASRDNTAKIWRASDGALTCALPHERQVFTALFSPDSTKLVTAVGDATARIWSVSDRGCSLLVTLQGHTDSVLSARFDRDGRRVITASTDGTARIWDVQTGQQLLVLRGHTGWVRRPSFSPDGSLALTAGDDGTARIWDANDGTLIAVLQHGGGVNSARFSNNGHYIGTASEDGIARLWKPKNGQLIAELRGHNDPVISAEFSPHDDWLVTAGLDGSVRLWPAPAATAQ